VESPLESAQRQLFQVTRLLEPTSGWFHRSFKGAEFRDSVESFIASLYALEWQDFSEARDFAIAEKMAKMILSVVELYVAAIYEVEDTSECAVFTDLIGQLRTAVDGLRQGLPPDPAKRPTRAAIDSEAEASLYEILKPSLPR
jgi:hypothetical protein